MINLKKFIKIIIGVFYILLFCVTFNKLSIKAEENLVIYGKSGIVIELDTGDILYNYNADEIKYPASTTKIMTLKLVFDALKNGIIKKDQLLTTSEYASSMGGSQIYLSVGEQMSVDELIKSVVIASANDAAVVLAEAISGSTELFVKQMNQEAQRLNMNNTVYKNVTGLHQIGHITSAKDLSIIARELLINYENEILPLSSTYEDYLRKDTDKPFWLVNTNKLIKGSSGIDGLKTGWTNEAGYCIVATKKENNMRLISVVMGADTPTHRNEDIIRLFNYAYANFDKQLISPKGSIVQTNEDFLTKPSIYNIILAQDISRIIKKSSTGGVITYELDINKENISGSSGTIIGKMHVYIDDKLYKSVDVELKEKVTKSTFIDLLLSVLENIL